MSDPISEKPRRFYKTVAVEPSEGGYGVKLDARNLRTPATQMLALPTQALAEAIAAEWDAQATEIDSARMPLSRLAFTAIDRGSQTRDALAEEFARYAGSDVLCYRAVEPKALIEREAAEWDPWLDWAEKQGIDLHVVEGLSHRPQPQASLERARALAAEMDDLRLTGLVGATALYGSAVLALALSRGEIGGEAALDVATLDERFQAERWGVDAEAAERTAGHQADARALELWFKALA
jgi:chaperone required for assembly of F1-ATPase